MQIADKSNNRLLKVPRQFYEPFKNQSVKIFRKCKFVETRICVIYNDYPVYCLIVTMLGYCAVALKYNATDC